MILRRSFAVIARVAASILIASAGCSCSAPSPHAELAAPSNTLGNFHRLNDRVFTGAQPEGDADFDALQSLGVKTILSVDGSSPDVASAQRHGLRYVHVPTTYATVTDAQRLEIARAVRDLPGPLYIHCHHGKHRGPAAAACAAIALGMITNDEGTAFIKAAGTAPAYAGLYEAVANAPRASDADLNSVSSDFPSIQRAHGTTAAMVEIDLAFDHLTAIKNAGWKTPKESPDLVPAAEAGRLTDNFRIAHEDLAYISGLPRDYTDRLQRMIQDASALEEGIASSVMASQLNDRFARVQNQCTACHALYRNKTIRGR